MSDQPPMPHMPPLPPMQPPVPPDNILPYAQSINPRPTILTVVAILSICIGSLGVLANFCGMFQWVSAISMQTMNIPVPATPVVVTAPTTSVAVADPAVVEVEDPFAEGPATGNPAAPAPTQSGVQTVTFSAVPVASPFSQMSIWPAILTSILSVVELALGGYLLFAGIQLLRNVASSRRHHLRYAALKIPITIMASAASAIAMYDMQQAIFSNMPPNASPFSGSFPLIVAVTTAAFSLVISLAYPIALTIVLTRRTIKAYFAEMHPAY